MEIAVCIRIMCVMIAFTSLSAVLLLTGDSKVELAAISYGSKIKNIPSLTKVPPLVHQAWLFLLVITSVYGLADIMRYENIKKFISQNFLRFILIWCLAVALSSAFGICLKAVKSTYFQLYAIVAIDACEGICGFVVSCLRMQLQMGMVIFPFYVAGFISSQNFDIYSNASIILAFGVLLYAFLVIMAIGICIKRFEQHMLWYDIMCLGCSLSLAMLVLDDTDNRWTPTFGFSTNNSPN